MPLTIDEIEKELLGGQRVWLPPEDVLNAFAAAEQVRGRDWILGATSLPGGLRQYGFLPFLRVYSFGKRVQTILGTQGADELIKRLSVGDAAAQSELTAIYLLRSRRPDVEVEISPEVVVGRRLRRPDFRIKRMAPWIYVEVTQLNESVASASTQDMLARIANQVISILQPFILEIVFWRDPTDGEEDELLRHACDACQATTGERRDVGDLASLMVKSGDPSFVVPSILPKDDGTRMGLALSIGGPGEPNRQIIARVPFADQRAESILTSQAKQLPKDESGLVMVDATMQPTAFNSWTELVRPRFTPRQHTRISGVLLFMGATQLTTQGMSSLHYVKLIPNPHAHLPLPAWITEVVEETRAEVRRLTSRPST